MKIKLSPVSGLFDFYFGFFTVNPDTQTTGIPVPTPPAKRKPVGRLIGAFKTVSTKHINEIRETPDMILWQRDFYEHIIRDEDDYQRIRQYILDNPIKWEKDDFYLEERRDR